MSGADVENLSRAIVGRLLPVIEPLETNWKVEWFKPEPVQHLPSLCVTTRPSGFADHTQVPTLWSFDLDFYLSAIDQGKSRHHMSIMTGKYGLIVATLEDPDIEDDLFDLAGLTVSATMAKGGGLKKERRNTYLSFGVGVQLSAD